jgi:acyl carrier protein
MSTTVDAIKRILARIKSEPSLSARLPDTADLVEEVGLDSLEMLQFMLEIEASLSVQVDFDKLEFSTLRSIHALAAFLDTMPSRPSPTGSG